jgi:hypothetical protein
MHCVPRKNGRVYPFDERPDVQEAYRRSTDANNDPMYRRMPGGNPSGFVCLIGAGMAFGASVAYAHHGGGWAFLATPASILAGVTMLVAGVRLLRKDVPRSEKTP